MNSDWLFLQAAVSEMEEYLHSQVIHWPLSNNKPRLQGGALPKLTIGNLCLARTRLSGSSSEKQIQEFDKIIEKIDAIRNRWRVNWGRKAEAEYRERLRLWKVFIEDELTQERGTSDYRNQVRLRVILELLDEEILAENLVHKTQLQILDEQVLSLTTPCEFIWDEKYQPGFPPGKFWFLYRS